MMRDDFGHIHDVDRGIAEVGFDDDFESLKFEIPTSI